MEAGAVEWVDGIQLHLIVKVVLRALGAAVMVRGGVGVWGCGGCGGVGVWGVWGCGGVGGWGKLTMKEPWRPGDSTGSWFVLLGKGGGSGFQFPYFPRVQLPRWHLLKPLERRNDTSSQGCHL